MFLTFLKRKKMKLLNGRMSLIIFTGNVTVPFSQYWFYVIFHTTNRGTEIQSRGTIHVFFRNYMKKPYDYLFLPVKQILYLKELYYFQEAHFNKKLMVHSNLHQSRN